MSSEQSHETSLADVYETPAEDQQLNDKDLDTDDCPSKTPDFTTSDQPDVLSESSNGEQNSKETVDVKSLTDEREMVEFKIIYNKQTHNVTFPLDDTVDSLKRHIESLTNVPIAMQKIMFKGRMKDDATLRENKLMNGSKLMVVGSTATDIQAVNQPVAKAKPEAKVDTTSGKEPLCKQKAHKTVLDKYGKPDDVMIGIKNKREPLPPTPLSGMYNKSGGKVRLTFKLENDQLWIGTKERTEKVSLTSIKAVVSEEIEGHEEYHLMGLQLGPTELSRYWIYWVPAQYIDAIKDVVLGNWQYF